jgi:hypothetical protein
MAWSSRTAGGIAEELTRQGIPSPSASDPGRNPHRYQVAWSKAVVRTILSNPRYTGREVWNKQRKDEVLLDVDDVALGTTTVLRWNDREQWVWSDYKVHDEIVAIEDFERAQQVRQRRAHGRYSKRGNPTRRPYVFRGRLRCGYCERKMQGNWNNDLAYYRCRFPAEYALVNKLEHPRVVYLREAEIIDPVQAWLATAFSPDRIAATIEIMTAQPAGPADDAAAEFRQRLAACDRKLRRYREALDAGADPVQVTGWINEATRERARVEAVLRAGVREERLSRRESVSGEEIARLLEQTGDLVRVVLEADPLDKADLFKELGLVMTYYPQRHEVEARVIPEPPHVRSVGVRGGT